MYVCMYTVDVTGVGMINEIKEPSMKKPTQVLSIPPAPASDKKKKLTKKSKADKESTKEEREEGEGTDDDVDDDDQDNSKDEEEEEEEDDENPYVSQIKRNAQLDYRGRYLTRPQDYLVICMAMISQHSDLDEGMYIRAYAYMYVGV